MEQSSQDSNPVLRVILADDHPIFLRGLELLLRHTPDFEVVRACADGVALLEDLRTLKPDIAVVDVDMPGLTGVQVLEAVARESMSTKIVFLTGTATDETIVAAINGGAWGIMFKEATADALGNCLNKVAKGERCYDPDIVGPAVERVSGRQNQVNTSGSVLTTREREIAALVAEGLSNKAIARKTNISEGTVKVHLYNAYRKLGVGNRTAFAALVQRLLTSHDQPH